MIPGLQLGEIQKLSQLSAINSFRNADFAWPGISWSLLQIKTIARADTICGYGTIHDLPDGAQNFTTIKLKSNFLSTASRQFIKQNVI
jgi:hypothetical protein